VVGDDEPWLCGSDFGTATRTSLGMANVVGFCGPTAKSTGELGGGIIWKGSESLALSSNGRFLLDLAFRVGCPAGGDDNQGS
jgi:hypothetical protein